MSSGESLLLPVKDVVPLKYQSAFPFENFNRMQSIMMKQIFETNDNLVIAAPTGCGKTILHEAAIIRMFSQREKFKCLYIAPAKALVQQKHLEWSQKFSPLGLVVLEVTGDTDAQHSLRQVSRAHVILTTPEKWDSLTRSWRSHLFLLGAIDLLLIDECHFLGEERGSTLEAVIVRLQMLKKTYMKKMNELYPQTIDSRLPIRMIALSATFPNVIDVGKFLLCKQSGIHYFDDGFRPVPLEVVTIGFQSCSNTFLFEKSLDDKVGDIVLRYSDNKPVLIFCSSKKGTETLATSLVYRLTKQSRKPHDNQFHALLNDISVDNLRKLISCGFAYHHAGLPPTDRHVVETLFLHRYIHTLAATTTLAQGMNLPAHLVIIKGTNAWRGGSRGYESLAKSEIIQMMGRAGRPGFDDVGVAVIMTSSHEKELYHSISLSADVVESTLLLRLIEALNTEISEVVIVTLGDALEWMKSTFFYIRVKRNPEHYHFHSNSSNNNNNNNMGVDGTTNVKEDEIDAKLTNIILTAIQQLDTAKIIHFNNNNSNNNNNNNSLDNQIITPNRECHLMSKYMISFASMLLLMKLPCHCDMLLLLSTVCQCSEVAKPLKRSEKQFLNNMNHHKHYNNNNSSNSHSVVDRNFVRYSVKGILRSDADKAFVLLQLVMNRFMVTTTTTTTTTASNKNSSQQQQPQQQQQHHQQQQHQLDFYMRVEQSEMVEGLMRILLLLSELSLLRLHGLLLENVVVLKYSLMSRLWIDLAMLTSTATTTATTDNEEETTATTTKKSVPSSLTTVHSIFEQCNNIPEALRKKLAVAATTTTTTTTPTRLLSYEEILLLPSLSRIQEACCGCNINEAKAILHFAKHCQQQQRFVTIQFHHFQQQQQQQEQQGNEENKRQQIGTIDFIVSNPNNNENNNNNNNNNNNSDEVEYTLVAYEKESGALICFRQFNNQQQGQQQQVFTVPLYAPTLPLYAPTLPSTTATTATTRLMVEANVHVSLLCSIAGLSSFIKPTTTATTATTAVKKSYKKPTAATTTTTTTTSTAPPTVSSFVNATTLMTTTTAATTTATTTSKNPFEEYSFAADASPRLQQQQQQQQQQQPSYHLIPHDNDMIYNTKAMKQQLNNNNNSSNNNRSEMSLLRAKQTELFSILNPLKRIKHFPTIMPTSTSATTTATAIATSATTTATERLFVNDSFVHAAVDETSCESAFSNNNSNNNGNNGGNVGNSFFPNANNNSSNSKSSFFQNNGFFQQEQQQRMSASVFSLPSTSEQQQQRQQQFISSFCVVDSDDDEDEEDEEIVQTINNNNNNNNNVNPMVLPLPPATTPAPLAATATATMATSTTSSFREIKAFPEQQQQQQEMKPSSLPSSLLVQSGRPMPSLKQLKFQPMF